MRKMSVTFFALLICFVAVFSACGQKETAKESSDAEFDYSVENEFPLQNMTEAEQSFISVSGGLMGNDEVGYTMLGRSVMTTADDNIISGDKNIEISFNLKLAQNSNSMGFRVGINASPGDDNNIITGYCLTLAYQNDTNKVQLFGENIANWTKITDRYDVAESLSVFDWNRTYALKFRWVGNEITIWLDGVEVARGSNSVDRSVSPSKIYFWNAPNSNVSISNIVIQDCVSFAADAGEVSGNDADGYIMNGRSVMSSKENTLITSDGNYEISMKVKFEKADTINFRIGINASQGDNKNLITGYCLTFAWQNDTQKVNLFGENISDWSKITDGEKYVVSDGITGFDWDRTYELKMTWIGNTLSIYLDGTEIASGSNTVDRNISPSKLYIWNAPEGAVTHVSDIRILQVSDFGTSFGSVSGNDESGYLLVSNSAIYDRKENSLINAEISLDFSIAAQGWPNFRIMLGGTVNDADNGFTSGTGAGLDGICISIISDGISVTVGIQSRHDWKSYFSATLCEYGSFRFDEIYTCEIKISNGNNISLKIGNVIAQNIIIDEDEALNEASKLYLWNPGLQDTTVKNIIVAAEA